MCTKNISFFFLKELKILVVITMSGVRNFTCGSKYNIYITSIKENYIFSTKKKKQQQKKKYKHMNTYINTKKI